MARLRISLIALLVLSFGLVRTAMAHAILIDSTPAPLAHVAVGRLAIILRYNSRIDAGRSKITLRSGDNLIRIRQDDPGGPDLMRAGLDLTPGDYTIAWQVLATDGHITRGTLPFTVDRPQAQAAAH